MELIPEAEVERLMRVRDVMLQAIAKKITWWQAAEILGVHEQCGGGNGSMTNTGFAGFETKGRVNRVGAKFRWTR
jgi:hypothetical protein